MARRQPEVPAPDPAAVPAPARPTAPVRAEPNGWEHYELWQRVCDAVRSLPDHFKTATNIEGMLATDIFTLNSALGATIEEQVVSSLNSLRPVWDPQKNYQTHAFVRQPQTFPDVVLRRKTNGQEILMGIELKGWYLLANEGMPNFRFTQSAAACNPQDLVVVVPWALSNVLSGSPIAYSPFLESAKFCAEQRNYYWEHGREAQGDRTITLAVGIGPYPRKSDQISDRANHDPGGNFGRLARYGIMNQYVTDMMRTPLAGIPVSAWLAFLRAHARAERA
jgi:hypothetical protein